MVGNKVLLKQNFSIGTTLNSMINIDEVKNIIMELFSGHPDLLQGFTYFLPESNVNSSIFS